MQKRRKAGRVGRHVMRLARAPAAPSTRGPLPPAPTESLHLSTPRSSPAVRARAAFSACQPWVIGAQLCCVLHATATALNPHSRITNLPASPRSESSPTLLPSSLVREQSQHNWCTCHDPHVPCRYADPPLHMVLQARGRISGCPGAAEAESGGLLCPPRLLSE